MCAWSLPLTACVIAVGLKSVSPFSPRPDAMEQPISRSATQPSFGSAHTLEEGSEPDDLWDQAFQKALRKLPAKDSEWLADEQNQKAFSSTQIIEAIQPFLEKYSNHPVQRFLAQIDPIVTHVRSFTDAIHTFTYANPTGARMVWGCVYLVLMVRTLISDRTHTRLRVTGGWQVAAIVGKNTRLSIRVESPTCALLPLASDIPTEVFR